jgi:hypothetical protein
VVEVTRGTADIEPRVVHRLAVDVIGDRLVAAQTIGILDLRERAAVADPAVVGPWLMRRRDRPRVPPAVERHDGRGRRPVVRHVGQLVEASGLALGVIGSGPRIGAPPLELRMALGCVAGEQLTNDRQSRHGSLIAAVDGGEHRREQKTDKADEEKQP